jgi:SAM-dependent methyltransferase
VSASGRIFAALHDPLLWSAERAGMRDRRRRLVGRARGRVVEIGAGTGLNVEHYGAQVSELVLAEPEEAVLGRLERRLRARGGEGRVVRTTAEEMPFDDASFDTVVSTLTLCTVADPAAALAEIRRVLGTDGQLLFVEHVRAAEGSRLAGWQDRLRRPWRAVAHGCQCNRDTLGLMSAAGFAIADVEHGEWRRVPPIVRPLIAGSAQARL